MTAGVQLGSASAAVVAVVAMAARSAARRRRATRVVGRLRLAAGAASRGRRRRTVPAPVRVAALLADAGVDSPPDAVCTAAVVACVAVALLGALAGGVALGVLLPTLAATGGLGTLVALRGRGDRRYAGGLPPALDVVARSLRAGGSLHQAIADAAESTPGPLGADLRHVAHATLRLGRPLVAAIDDWAARRPLPGVELAAVALALGAETGGAQARAIDGVAATLRERLALDGEVRALTSQARTSALVLAVAPVAFCAATVLADADSATFLLRTPAGLVMLTAGLALDGVAAAWMHRLTRRVAS